MRALPAVLLFSACFSSGLPDLSRGNDAAVYPLFSDDFETEGLFPDAGGWTSYAAPAGSSMMRTPEAAHRGAHGVTYQATSTGTGNATCSRLQQSLSRDAGVREASLRTWSRLRTTTSNGYVISMYLESENGSDPTQGGYSVPLSLIHNAENADNTQFIKNIGLGYDAGWALMEISVSECEDGGRCQARLFVDAVERWKQQVERGTTRIVNFGIGAQFCGREFAGVIDFDDVRFAAGPQPSKLEISSDSAGVGECAPLRIDLLDSFGQPADAPYDFDIDVYVDGGETFGDEQCTTPGKVPLRKGGRATSAWWKPPRSGAFLGSASNVDFVTKPARLDAR